MFIFNTSQTFCNVSILPSWLFISFKIVGYVIPVNSESINLFTLCFSISEIILLGEGVSTSDGTAMAVFEDPADPWLPGSVTSKSPDTLISDTTESDDGALSYRANGYTLVAFVDGHAEALRKGTVKYKNIVTN